VQPPDTCFIFVFYAISQIPSAHLLFFLFRGDVSDDPLDASQSASDLIGSGGPTQESTASRAVNASRHRASVSLANAKARQVLEQQEKLFVLLLFLFLPLFLFLYLV
jgi:hypothetical protein